MAGVIKKKYSPVCLSTSGSPKFPLAHLSFFSSFLSFFLASWLPAAACFESSSALAFFTWFSFTICFLLVGIHHLATLLADSYELFSFLNYPCICRRHGLLTVATLAIVGCSDDPTGVLTSTNTGLALSGTVVPFDLRNVVSIPLKAFFYYSRPWQGPHH
jgi:hypothetical protein